jgi:ABC-2 type transport system ATP-binding protein
MGDQRRRGCRSGSSTPPRVIKVRPNRPAWGPGRSGERSPAGAHPPSGESGLAIACDRLTRRFGQFVAVDAVSLSIQPGRIFGLLGPNGAGKTTLIRMLRGLLPPSQGRARVAGVDVGAPPRPLRQRIGYMSQRFSLYPDLTLGENLAFFASAYGLRRRVARAAIGWVAAMTGLAGLEQEDVQSLSAALRRRLALACAVLHRPQVLFLDEPTSGIARTRSTDSFPGMP